MTFKKWLKKNLKLKHLDLGEKDFAQDVKDDKDWREPKNLDSLLQYLQDSNASDSCIEVAKSAFKKWQELDSKAPVDGLGPREIKAIRTALRLVWHRSHARKLVVQRCTGKDGFARCEKCKKRTPTLKVDHKTPCGDVDEGFIFRMWSPSRVLQGLCPKCHNEKTKAERKAAKANHGVSKIVSKNKVNKDTPKTKRKFTDDF